MLEILHNVCSLDIVREKSIKEDFFLTGDINKVRPPGHIRTSQLLAKKMVALLFERLMQPYTVLEPCAGTGTIVDELLERDVQVIYGELDLGLNRELRKKYARTSASFSHFDFIKEANHLKGLFNSIVMNPPFIGERSNYAAFIIKALEILPPHGQMVSLIPKLGLARLKTNREMLLSIFACRKFTIEDVDFDCTYGAKVSILNCIK